MTGTDLAALYRAYIACLNRQDWAQLGDFVGEDVRHNGRLLGLAGYRDMLETDFRTIPDLHFDIQLLACEWPFVASRLMFTCAPAGKFLGLDVGGRRVTFAENVFYHIQADRITEVWSVIDKEAIEVQLRRR